MNNRIKKYLRREPEEVAKCIVICDDLNARVVLSCEGQKLIWYWYSSDKESGLKIPSSERVYPIHPLAAEAYIAEEIGQFMAIQRMGPDDIIAVNTAGVAIDGVRLNPPELGKIDFEVVYKKEMVKDLYNRYLEGGSLTDDIVSEAISCDVLKPLLSLTNLE